ncbi:MAG: EAL domain-containing protein [Sulfuricurvum sp.]|jgi:diguanylate cyclase (GGDEF)-like protein/PAS domain S-box-containing protein
MNESLNCISLESSIGELTLSPLEYNQILDIQQNIFELLLVGRNQQEVLERLCHLAESILPNSVASIMLLDPLTGSMSVVAAPSMPAVGHEALEELKPGVGGGSCGNAVFHNEAQFVQDAKTDERWSDIRHIAYDFNLCSCWSMPIRDLSNNAAGSFALSSFEHRAPSDFHKRLLENCAFIVAMVLKRSEYETHIDENQKKLQILGTAIQNASDGMVVTDSDNNIIEVNNAFMTTFGYTDKNEVMGKNPKIFASGKHDQQFYDHMWDNLKHNGHWSGEVWNKRSNGEIFPEWMSITAILDDQKKINNYLAVFSDLSELRESQIKQVELAFFDQLTSLPNRQKIVADIDQKHPKACALFNIDDFKEINDFFGIDAGDSILYQVGQWLIEMGFFPYRTGGDEFAILFYDYTTWNQLHHQITTLMAMLEEKVFIVSDETFSIRMSIGVAMGVGKLLTRADIALHRAKEKKIPIALYEEDENIEEIYRTNIAMASSIRKALANQRIICHYQPIVNLSTGTIDKYETLVRMIDENGEMVSPMDFLPIAKKTKVYSQITREVVYQACSLFSTRSESFSINLSDSDIRDPHTVQEIIKTITKTGTASRIVFEILESEGIESYEEVVQFIDQVKSLGAKISIDDFGTGYSNFENVLKLNVDYVKIDGSLIQGITGNSRHNIIVDSIVDFARKIGAQTIAEFVSDEAIYNAVIKHGIDYSQGYYTGKPASL